MTMFLNTGSALQQSFIFDKAYYQALNSFEMKMMTHDDKQDKHFIRQWRIAKCFL